jgi:hypothetical protein
LVGRIFNPNTVFLALLADYQCMLP